MKPASLLALLSVLACGCKPNPTTTWKPLLDGGHHIGTTGATLLAFAYDENPERSIVFYFPFDINSSADHTSDTRSRTFDYSGTITTSPDNETVLSYHLSSSDVTRIRSNETDFELGNGSVFHVARDGTVTQLPFSGLQPTKEYVVKLQQYFEGPDSMTRDAPDEF